MVFIINQISCSTNSTKKENEKPNVFKDVQLEQGFLSINMRSLISSSDSLIFYFTSDSFYGVIDKNRVNVRQVEYELINRLLFLIN